MDLSRIYSQLTGSAPGVPEPLLRAAARHAETCDSWELTSVLLARVDLPGDLVAGWTTSSEIYVRALALSHPNLPAECAEQVRTERAVTVLSQVAARAVDPLVLAALAGNRHAPAAVLLDALLNPALPEQVAETALLSLDRTRATKAAWGPQSNTSWTAAMTRWAHVLPLVLDRLSHPLQLACAPFLDGSPGWQALCDGAIAQAEQDCAGGRPPTVKEVTALGAVMTVPACPTLVRERLAHLVLAREDQRIARPANRHQERLADAARTILHRNADAGQLSDEQAQLHVAHSSVGPELTRLAARADLAAAATAALVANRQLSLTERGRLAGEDPVLRAVLLESVGSDGAIGLLRRVGPSWRTDVPAELFVTVAQELLRQQLDGAHPDWQADMSSYLGAVLPSMPWQDLLAAMRLAPVAVAVRAELDVMWASSDAQMLFDTLAPTFEGTFEQLLLAIEQVCAPTRT